MEPRSTTPPPRKPTSTMSLVAANPEPWFMQQEYRGSTEVPSVRRARDPPSPPKTVPPKRPPSLVRHRTPSPGLERSTTPPRRGRVSMLDEFKKIQKSSEKPLNPRRKTLNFADEISRQSTALKDITEWDRESGWESHIPTPQQSVRDPYVPLLEPLQ